MCYWTSIATKTLTGDDLDTLAVNGHRQNLAPGFLNGRFNALAGIWFDEKDHAATSTRTADFASQSAVAAGVFDDPVDGLR